MSNKTLLGENTKPFISETMTDNLRVWHWVSILSLLTVMLWGAILSLVPFNIYVKLLGVIIRKSETWCHNHADNAQHCYICVRCKCARLRSVPRLGGRLDVDQ